MLGKKFISSKLGYAYETIRAVKNVLTFSDQPDITTKFLILSSGRSGSTLLETMLNSNEGVHCRGEIMSKRLFSPISYIDYCEKQRRNCEIYGFKLLTYQIIYTQRLSPEKLLTHLTDNGYKLIYLQRQNIVDIAVSFHYATKRGVWHQKNDLANKEISIDPLLFLDTMKQIERDHNTELDLVEQFDHLRLIYEDDLMDESKQVTTLQKLSEFLDSSRSFQYRSQLKKIIKGKSITRFSNSDEVVKAIEGTPYSRYL